MNKSNITFENSNITSTVYNEDNNSYYNLVNNEIWQYDLKNNDFDKLNENSAFKNSRIISIFYYDKNLYADFKNLGIAKLDLNNLLNPIFYNIPNYITTYYYNNNMVYLGSQNQGLTSIDSNNKVTYYQNNTKKLPMILSIFQGFDKKIYCGVLSDPENNYGGIWSMQQSNISEYEPSIGVLSKLSIYNILNFNNKIYAFTNDGIYYLTADMTKFVKLITNSLIDHSSIISYYYNENILYLGTSNNGLWSFNLNNNKVNNLISLNIKSDSTINNISLQNNILIINKKNNIKNSSGQIYYSI